MNTYLKKGKFLTWVLLAGVAAIMLVASSCGSDDDDASAELPNAVRPGSKLAGMAAQNEPVAGSVTQGSRGSDGVTTDTVEVLNDGQRVSINESAFLERTGDRAGGGASYAADNGRAIVFGQGPVFSGFWSILDGDTEVWGMFVDGVETPAGQIPEVETCYLGTATIYTHIDGRSIDPDNQEVHPPTINIRLNNDGVVSGGGLVEGQIRITLDDAEREDDSTLFKGSASSIDQNDSNSSANIDDGNWGLQFFNGEGAGAADMVGGTFGLSQEDLGAVAVGTFTASQEPCPSQ